MNKMLYWYSLLAILTVAGAAQAATASSGLVTVTEIDAYSNGNLYLKFNQSVSSTCGSKLRANDANNDHVLKVATAAMLAGKSVIANFEDTKVGSFCDLIYLRVVN